MSSNGSRAAVLAAFVAAAVVLFIVLSGDDDSGDSTATTSANTAPATAAKPPAPKPQVTTIQVKGGAPVGGIKQITATKGDTVKLTVLPEAGDEEVHVHGYEIEAPVEGTKPVDLSFVADIEGGFEIEVHGGSGDFQIAELTVEPS